MKKAVFLLAFVISFYAHAELSADERGLFQCLKGLDSLPALAKEILVKGVYNEPLFSEHGNYQRPDGVIEIGVYTLSEHEVKFESSGQALKEVKGSIPRGDYTPIDSGNKGRVTIVTGNKTADANLSSRINGLISNVTTMIARPNPEIRIDAETGKSLRAALESCRLPLVLSYSPAKTLFDEKYNGRPYLDYLSPPNGPAGGPQSTVP
jgi:hypothetical protein